MARMETPRGNRCGDTGPSSNLSRQTREEMEEMDVHHLKTRCTPFPATVTDLFWLEQDTGESLCHYIWRFRGVVDHIPPEQLRVDPIIAAFYTNIHCKKMCEKLRTHVVHTLDELWERANQCARGEDACNFPSIEVV